MNTTKHVERIAYYCQCNRKELMSKMDYYTVNEIGGYLGVRLRGGKVLAVAHMDFLGTGKVHSANKKGVVSSALDDRLGIYAAMEALPAMGVECDVLLCDDEESANSSIQSVGMGFLNRYNWIVQLDCSGVRAVTYGYKSMAGALRTVWSDVQYGAFSDITSVEHVCPVGAFNAGVGYHLQHSEGCHVKMSEFLTAMGRVKTFYDMFKDVRFEEEQAQINGECNHIYENKSDFWGMDKWDDPAEDGPRTVLPSDAVTRYSDYPSTLDEQVPYMTGDSADQFIDRLRESRRLQPFLDGDGAHMSGDGHQELEVCEMCSKILMHDEVYLYQGWPLCQEHYMMMVADEVDAEGNLAPNTQDIWE